MDTLKKKSKLPDIFSVIILAITFIWQLPLIFLGIDIADSSYYVAHYKHFFATKEIQFFSMGLSNLFGALIYKFIPSHQYLVLQVLGILFVDIAILAVWLVLRKKTNKSHILLTREKELREH